MLAELDKSTQVTIKVIATFIVIIPLIAGGIFFYVFKDHYLPQSFYVKDLDLYIKTENCNGNAKISLSRNKPSGNDYILWQNGDDMEISVISPDTFIISRDHRLKNVSSDKLHFMIMDDEGPVNNESGLKHEHIQNINKPADYKIFVSYDLRNTYVRRCTDSVIIYNSRIKP